MNHFMLPYGILNNIYLTTLFQAFYFAGVASVSYAAAIVLALAIEYPCANLEKVFLPSRPRAKRDDRDYQEERENTIVSVVVPPPNSEVRARSTAHERGITDINRQT